MKQEKISMKVMGAIVATGILSFCGVLGETAMNVAFPTFIQEFQITTAQVQWLTTIYLLTLSIVVPLSGFFKHSFKSKTIFIASIIIFSSGVLIAAVSSNFSILLVGRAIQGFGTGIALPLMFNIIIEQVPLSKIGMMMGVGTMIPAIAPAIGPIFGGIVITQLGWRYIFILLLPILIIAFFVGLFTIEQKNEISHKKLDVTSLLMIVFIFTGLIYAFGNLGTYTFFSIHVLGTLIVALLGVVGLIYSTNHVKNPLLNLKLLLNKAYLNHVISFFIIQLVLMGLVFILPNYIQIVNGENAQLSGFVVFPGAALGALLTPVGGKLLDMLGPKKPITLGSLLLLFSLIIYYFTANQMSNFLIGSLYFIFTLGIGLTFGNLMTNGLNQLSKETQPDGNAIIMTFQQVAGAMGTSLVASILSISQSKTELTNISGTIQGSKNSFIFLILLSLIELLIVVTLFWKKSIKN
ncbi:MAG: DHA2 family efflux MFS transporter permease subunit [Lactovum sp.]